MFSSGKKQHSLTANEKEIVKKILTGRAGYDASTGDGVAGADETAAAQVRSATSFIVLLMAISTVAHKTMSVGKRRLVNEREIAFAQLLLSSSFELFDPHNDPTHTDEGKADNWASARVNVLAGSIASREDFGMSPSSPLLGTPMNGNFLVYAWYILLHECDMWDPRQRRRIDSTGPNADRSFCIQMCLRAGFNEKVLPIPGIATWFVVDPALNDTTGAIVIKQMPSPHNEHALQYLRMRGIPPYECSIAALNQLQCTGTAFSFLKRTQRIHSIQHMIHGLNCSSLRPIP